MREPYEFYVEYYGRVRSGYKIKEDDYYYLEDDPSGGKERKEYDIRIKIAISMAAEHVKTPYNNMYSKSAFEKELEDRLS